MNAFSRLTAAVCSAAALSLATADAVAADPVRMVAKLTSRTENVEPLYASEAQGRMVYRFSGKGRVTNVEGTALFDGADVSVRGTFDLVQGTGTGHGINVATKGGDSVASQWTGICTTLPRAEGKPLVHCAGGFFLIPGSGTGRFAGLTGGGSWRGSVLPNGDFDETDEAYVMLPGR